MARCLRCKAGNEWIEGDVKPAPAEVAGGAGEIPSLEESANVILRAAVLLESFADFGMMEVDEDGRVTENAILCAQTAKALRAAPSLTHDFDLLQTLRLRCNYIINGYSDAKLEAKEMGRLIGEALRAKVREHAERERK